jgi:hypothetical protein
MADPRLVAALVLVGCAVGTGIHEACHYGAARLFGRPTRIDIGDCAVYYAAGDELGLEEYLIAGAPVIVGVAIAGGALAAPVRLEWWTAIPWVWMTFGGVRNDFDFRAVRTTRAE